jgi:hypothetical protein
LDVFDEFEEIRRCAFLGTCGAVVAGKTNDRSLRLDGDRIELRAGWALDEVPVGAEKAWELTNLKRR